MTGRQSYLAGLHAEEQVAQAYRDSGRPVVARRWRGTRGEIDVIAREGDRVVFIEVKKSRTHDMAALHLSESQMRRLWMTAEEYLGREPAGLLTEARVDVALVDGAGRIEIIENVMAA